MPCSQPSSWSPPSWPQVWVSCELSKLLVLFECEGCNTHLWDGAWCAPDPPCSDIFLFRNISKGFPGLGCSPGREDRGICLPQALYSVQCQTKKAGPIVQIWGEEALPDTCDSMVQLEAASWLHPFLPELLSPSLEHPREEDKLSVENCLPVATGRFKLAITDNKGTELCEARSLVNVYFSLHVLKKVNMDISTLQIFWLELKTGKNKRDSQLS